VDADVKVHYQCLVGSLLYLVLCIRPNIAYVAIALGQYNMNLSRAHLLAIKGGLCYLLGTLDFALEYNFTQSPGGPLLLVFLLSNCAFTDADWATDKTN